MSEVQVPGVEEVRGLLEKMNEEWSRFEHLAAVGNQIKALRAVSGTIWYVDLELVAGAPALPSDGPNPLPGGLEAYKPGGQPSGTLFVWLRNGRISQIEFGAYEMETVDHYPSVVDTRLIRLGGTFEELGDDGW